MPENHIQQQIDLIAKHEQDFLSQRTRGERFADAIAAWIGSLTFVTAHIIFFATWITLNRIHGHHHWDPRPFSLLQCIVAMESILAASFILIRQSRLGRRSDERDHLMLQILLLTEKEITASLHMNRQIAEEMGLHKEANTQEVQELSKDTSIDEVAQTIKETLPEK
jgi:uncharacterized membrane protein